ncbi:MAG: Asp-tRNA(Asn)/Glu-tRNA(Gln) amidotransferase subunit GatC [Candidatus Dadabacteria bacterium]|nr:MAG: Asp-tRNA(Asn)/Glu-tRNA(Gln) amidotransferase subunit GatC [Candidatus Dadabacteria bacterium]
MVSKEEVYKIAQLARIGITEEEAQRFSEELSSILDHVKKLDSVDVSSVEPMTHVHGSFNFFRSDRVEDSFPIEDVLANAPDTNGQFFKVPIIKG